MLTIRVAFDCNVFVCDQKKKAYTVDVRYPYTKKAIADKTECLRYHRGDHMIADMLTRPLEMIEFCPFMTDAGLFYWRNTSIQ